MPKAASLQRILSNETVAKLRRIASSSALTLNALLLGTLASFVHELCSQQRFSIAQSYLGRQMDQLRTLGSFSGSAPMVFSFEGAPSLRATCRHVLEETQRMMATKFLGAATGATVHYELNDLRPMRIPSAGDTVQSHAIPGLMILVVEYADGFLLLVFYNVGKYHEAGVQTFLAEWMHTLDNFSLEALG
jgi:hypothetical protein